jgi:hypothetical protein
MAQIPRPRHRNDFEIALICALRIEHDAVEALLDENYETDGFSYGKAPGDDNAYTLGRIGNHHVVLVQMPGMGKAYAAGVASSLRTSFDGIKLGILVGICRHLRRRPKYCRRRRNSPGRCRYQHDCDSDRPRPTVSTQVCQEGLSRREP